MPPPLPAWDRAAALTPRGGEPADFAASFSPVRPSSTAGRTLAAQLCTPPGVRRGRPSSPFSPFSPLEKAGRTLSPSQPRGLERFSEPLDACSTALGEPLSTGPRGGSRGRASSANSIATLDRRASATERGSAAEPVSPLGKQDASLQMSTHESFAPDTLQATQPSPIAVRSPARAATPSRKDRSTLDAMQTPEHLATPGRSAQSDPDAFGPPAWCDASWLRSTSTRAGNHHI